jgi:hypothetical protein
VGAGQNVSGIDITVVPPSSAAQPNAELLGTGNTAQNVGATLHRGQSVGVLLFGRGMSGALTVSIGGPNDIAISNVRSITSTDNTPGIAFDVAVSGSAALGARSVILKSTANDMTTFTGGLEVLP